MGGDAERLTELRQIVEAVRDRVRARYPAPAEGATSAGAAIRISPADLMPIVHARDAAQAKIAAIGSVNPRGGGLANRAIQAVKKTAARGLRWFVREQIVFNREMVSAVEAILEALNDHNRALLSLAAQTGERLPEGGGRAASSEELSDMRSHWTEWRSGWEQKLAAHEIQFLRSVADLQGAFQHRVTLVESNFRELVNSQHADYLGALDRANLEIQKRLWADMEKIRWQYERMIHAELRLIRQRLAGPRIEAAPAGGELRPDARPAEGPWLDYGRFAERFRGPEEAVRKAQEFYKPWFQDRERVLDIGCGRGEFLSLMQEMGIVAKGIDLGPESVKECREKGLDAEAADLFAFLANAADDEFDGIFSSQVVEHIEPLQLPRMISLCARKLRRGGVIAIETPNPECLAIFATFFYLDPTHTRPVPPALLEFYMTEAGLSEIEVHQRAPALETAPELAQLPEGVRERFFGGLDYAMIGRKL